MRNVRLSRGDIALVAVLLLVTVLPYALLAITFNRLAFGIVGLVQIVPLLWRRHAPLAVFAVVVLGCFMQLFVTDIAVASDVGLFVAYYAVIVHRGWRWWGIGASVVCGIGAVLGAADWVTDAVLPHSRADYTNIAVVALVGGLCTAVVAALAEAGRRRVELVEQLRARAIAAERERDQQMVIAAQAERARIAREMHDVVAHALAVIVVQADGAGHALSRMPAPPEVATRALDTIGRTARQALGETRALVGVLRTGGGPELGPTGGLADLPGLVARLDGTGTRVHLDTDGVDLAAIPDGVGRAALRVVQEAVTNSLKHAGPGAQVWITLRREDSLLRVGVEDDGVGPQASMDGGGSGLIGMQERVAAHGGRLHVGPRADGGFVVSADLPW